MPNNHAIDFDAIVPSQLQHAVAVEVLDNGKARIYRRPPGSSSVKSEDIRFHPWLLLADKSLTHLLDNIAETTELDGDNEFQIRVSFPDYTAYDQAIKTLRDETGKNPSAQDAPYRLFNDLTQQFLTIHPGRLFRGLKFDDVRRMQIDIETYTAPGFDFSNADREQDAIIMIAMRDNTGWEHLLTGPEMSEKKMLENLVEIVHERDPDVIEGHNIFNFDLPYIETRCKRHKVKLALGRDGSRMKSRSSRFTAAERQSSYTRFDCHGRHIIDTLHLTQLYDMVHRNLDSFGLKAVARHFGVAATDRTYVRGENIARVYDENPERLRDYAMDDVRETEAISAILSPSYFYQAQLVPFSYQNCVSRGSATRIDAMLVAAYMRGDHSLPKPQQARSFSGGLTESLETGVFNNVWHVDVASLYPSIIISRNLQPATDTAKVFTNLLCELRNFRLEAKKATREADNQADRDHFDALQSSFKILINSFYGYLGFQMATFNDFDMAENVTAKGREILRGMVDFLEDRGAKVIETDTDGVYFVPPDDVEDDTDAMEKEIQDTLPEGIEVELDDTFQAMFGYKSKNYALLDHNGELSLKGAALKSRGLEPFQRNFIREVITLLLNDRTKEYPDLYTKYRNALKNHEFPLADLAKRENLSTAPRVYKQKLDAGKTRRSAAYELVLASNREYKQGDQVAFYVTGGKKSVSVSENAKLLQDAPEDERGENVPYYLDKLEKLHEKFADFLPDPHQQELFG